MLKKIKLAVVALLLPLLAFGQSYPSPTFQNLTVNGTLTAANQSFTNPLPVASGGTNCATASGTCLDNITGFASTGFLTRTGAGTYAFQSLTNGITYANLAQAGANTLLGNATGSTANVTAITVTGCNGAAQALQWTNGTGFGCNSNVATSGANANITSLSGLSTPLSVGQGGTGRATLTSHAALIGAGTSAVTQVAPSTAGQALISAGATSDPIWGYPTGTLIGVRVITSTQTYTPTAGTNSIIVELLGGGGAGGGSPATAAGQIAVGGGGGAGAYSISRITSSFSGVTVTIGAGGAGASGASGGNGGASSFGALMTANGGSGGAIGGGATSTPTISLPSCGAPTASGGNIANINGNCGEYGESIAAGLNVGGKGAASPYGVSGGIGVNGSAPGAGSGYGAGGSGSAISASSAAQAGAAGMPGICIIYEYN